MRDNDEIASAARARSRDATQIEPAASRNGGRTGRLTHTPTVRESDYPAPAALAEADTLIWDEDAPAVDNYVTFGQRLATSGDLYRNSTYAGGLMLASPAANVPPTPITKGVELAAIIVDRVRVQVVKGGKPRGSRIPTAHLGTMLAAECFLQQFRPIDTVTRTAIYLPDFRLTGPGYTDGGPGHRVFYTGDEPRIATGTATIRRFLDVMAFASNADRTNSVAAALTVMLHNHWPGSKPLLAVTASKSHAGKDTIVMFAAGSNRTSSISHESTDWAVQQAFVTAVKHDPETAVINVENARLDRGQFIASAYIERFITDPQPMLFSSGVGAPITRHNDLVVAITTNFGSLSTDLMNRSLPIHLTPTGNIEDRKSPIGNPKLEFLPTHREIIEAELRGMVEKWKQAGRPLDTHVKHPMTQWAQTIGGILKVNGFTDFLGNYSLRKAVDDPLRRGLGLLGAARPDSWLDPNEWAKLAAHLGLVKVLIPAADRESEEGRRRGMGVVLSAHRDETVSGESDDERLILRLEKARRRFEGGKVSTRYRFEVVERHLLPADDDVADNSAEPASDHGPGTPAGESNDSEIAGPGAGN